MDTQSGEAQPSTVAGVLIDAVVLTCEHGGNRIPKPYQHLFQSAEDRALLDSHRGFDAGALLMARNLADGLAVPLVSASISRLLVDLNRSLENPRVYSQVVRGAPAALRRQIVEQYYRPYRTRTERLLREAIAQGRLVLHLSCHSFTPELDGEVRNADIGLLYDPTRPGELEFCKRWQTSIRSCAPELKVRRNYPYQGKNDGFTTYLRRCFTPGEYIGIELELNQKHVMRSGQIRAALPETLLESLRRALASVGFKAPAEAIPL